MNELRRCPKCREWLPVGMFYPSRTVKSGLSSYCKLCQRARSTSLSRRLRGIRLTDAEYAALVAAQKGLCAICGQAERTARQLAVDHDHQTGEIRGLLCGRCNRLLGFLETPSGTMDRVRAYLSRAGPYDARVRHMAEAGVTAAP